MGGNLQIGDPDFIIHELSDVIKPQNASENGDKTKLDYSKFNVKKIDGINLCFNALANEYYMQCETPKIELSSRKDKESRNLKALEKM